MAVNEGERNWSQAVDDGAYDLAQEIATEMTQQDIRERAYDSVYGTEAPLGETVVDPVAQENARRRQRLLRAFGPAIDPEHLLYTGPSLPRYTDCIDKRAF